MYNTAFTPGGTLLRFLSRLRAFLPNCPSLAILMLLFY